MSVFEYNMLLFMTLGDFLLPETLGGFTGLESGRKIEGHSMVFISDALLII